MTNLDKGLISCLFAAALVGSACGEDSASEACHVGTPVCRCYEDGSCNPGLTCNELGLCGKASVSADVGADAGTDAAPVEGDSGALLPSPAQPDENAGGATGAPASPAGAPAMGGTASLLEECNVNFNCWSTAGTPAGPVLSQLRRLAGKCVLGIGDRAEVLNPDGTAEYGRNYQLDESENLLLCADDQKLGYCTNICSRNNFIRYPCQGTPVTSCRGLPSAVCESVFGCFFDTEGLCDGWVAHCEAMWEEQACIDQGCRWEP